MNAMYCDIIYCILNSILVRIYYEENDTKLFDYWLWQVTSICSEPIMIVIASAVLNLAPLQGKSLEVLFN